MTHYDDINWIPPARLTSSQFRRLANNQALFTASGHSKRNKGWDQKLGSYNLRIGPIDQTDSYEIQEILEAMEVNIDSFNHRDWADWNTTKGNMGPDGDLLVTNVDAPMKNTVTGTFVGDNSTTTFQLYKSYIPTGSTAQHNREIKKPQNTIVVALDGTPEAGFTLDITTGIATFSVAPGTNVVPTWGGKFLVPIILTETPAISPVNVSSNSSWIVSLNVSAVEIRV